MAEFHPLRQAAEADFLTALEHLSGTFGALDTAGLAPSDSSSLFENDEMASEILVNPEALVGDAPAISEAMSGAIAEGYDGQAVRNDSKD